MALKAHLIGGKWVEGGEGAADINPSDIKDVVGTFARADRATAERAIGAAKEAFPAWSRSTPQQRFDLLDASGDEILKRRQELGELLSREEGKPLADGIGEAGRAGQIFKFFAGEALRLAGERVASVRPGVEIDVTREPLGVVGLITPWNFPLAIPAWKIAPALAYGNTVVFKPADLVPGSAWAIAEILSRHGLPEGAFNLVMGRGAVVGEAILDIARRRGGELHRQHRDRPAHRREVRRAPRPLPARDGRQESARGARRRRSRHGRQRRRQRRLLPDRAALHRLLAPDRDRTDPRPLRRRGGRGHEGAQGRPRAQARDPGRPGGRPEPARAGPALCRDRSERRVAG